MAWFDEDPDRLQREMTALEAADLEYTIDEQLRDDHQLLRLRVRGPVAGDIRTWVCTFPDAYPYFAPVVTGETDGDLAYRHHHHPISGQFCLLPEGHGLWKPASMRLADLLTEQWPKFLAAQDDEQFVGAASPGIEVPQAEPWSRYLPYADQQESLLWDSTLEPPPVVSAGFARGLKLSRYGGLKWLATAVTDVDGTTLAQRPLRDQAREFYHTCAEQALPWVRLTAAPTDADPQSWWNAAAEAWGAAKPPSVTRSRGGAGPTRRILVGFPEEVAHRELGTGWVVVHERQRQGRSIVPARFERVVRIGLDDLAQRAPQLAPMRTKRILVAGLGGIGREVVRLLAPTCPARLVLWDRDTVEADTAIRWNGALAADGVPKAQVLAAEVLDTQPHTEVEVIVAPVGGCRVPGPDGTVLATDFHTELVRRLGDVDLVIDATADRSVQHYLSDQSRRYRVAYVRADAQYGVWAGLVALQRPEAEVCWLCWVHHSTDGTLPALPSDPNGEVQPPGCAQPTYTGTGFDLSAVGAEAVRVAVTYLTEDHGDDQPHDIRTLRLRDEAGRLTLPTWDDHDLKQHPQCRHHR